MKKVFQAELEQVQHSIMMMYFCLDDTDCVGVIGPKAADKVEVKLLLDRKNCYNSPCKRQPARVKDLWRTNAQLRVLRPSCNEYSSTHVKTMILDNKVVLTGSLNLTHNAFEHNKEHVVRIVDPKCVQQFVEDFYRTWTESEVISTRDIDSMFQYHDKREREKAERGGSKWQNWKRQGRPLQRSLSAEMSTARAHSCAPLTSAEALVSSE